MGCFCKQTVLAMQPVAEFSASAQAGIGAGLGVGAGARLGVSVAAGAEIGVGLGDPAIAIPRQRVSIAAAWLAARWLPAPAWQPDPAWLEVDLPEPPMSPESLAVLLSLVQARQDCLLHLGLDLTIPAQAAKVARIIATLNLRLPALSEHLSDTTPWEGLAIQVEAAEHVTLAARAGLFMPQPNIPSVAIGPWRPLLAKIKALAPLIAIGQAPGLDLRAEAMPDILAELMRALLAIVIPSIDDLAVVLRIIGRFSAIARLQSTLGADPRSVAFGRVQAAVDRRLVAAAALLPLGELPSVPPNPGLLITADMVAAAVAIPAQTLDRLRWQVPRFDQLPVLTTVVPVVKLVGVLSGCGIDAIRQAPCGPECDARTASTAPT